MGKRPVRSPGGRLGRHRLVVRGLLRAPRAGVQRVMYEKVAFHAKVVVALGASAVSVLKDEPQWKADRYRLVGLMVSST